MLMAWERPTEILPPSPNRTSWTCAAMPAAMSPSAAAFTTALGAVLARMEGVIAFKALLDAFPSVDLAARRRDARPSPLRGLEMLLVSL